MSKTFSPFRLVVAIMGLVVLVGGSLFVYSTVFGNSTTTISYREAFEEFASQQDAGANAGQDDDRLPQVGVYRYSTTGSESIKSIVSASHDYPAESAVTITRSGCGVKMEWAPLRERSEFLEICRIDDRLVLTNYGGAHEFFGLRNEHSVTCPSQTWLIPDAEDLDNNKVVCEGSGLVHNRNTTSVKATEVFIDGKRIDGFVVVTEFVATGTFNGTTIRTMTFDEDGMLLSWSDVVDGFSKTPIGDADYTEEFSLTLMPK
jgi:PKD repeat protein